MTVRGYTLGRNVFPDGEEMSLPQATVLKQVGRLQKSPDDARVWPGHWWLLSPFGPRRPWLFGEDWKPTHYGEAQAKIDALFIKVFGPLPVWVNGPGSWGKFNLRRQRWLDEAMDFIESVAIPPGVDAEAMAQASEFFSEWCPSAGLPVFLRFKSIGLRAYFPDSLVDAEFEPDASWYADPRYMDNLGVAYQIELVKMGISPAKVLPSFPPTYSEELEAATVGELEAMQERAA